MLLLETKQGAPVFHLSASMGGKGAGVPVPLLKETSEFTRISLLLASPTSVSKKSFSSFPFFHLSL